MRPAPLLVRQELTRTLAIRHRPLLEEMMNLSSRMTVAPRR